MSRYNSPFQSSSREADGVVKLNLLFDSKPNRVSFIFIIDIYKNFIIQYID